MTMPPSGFSGISYQLMVGLRGSPGDSFVQQRFASRASGTRSTGILSSHSGQTQAVSGGINIQTPSDAHSCSSTMSHQIVLCPEQQNYSCEPRESMRISVHMMLSTLVLVVQAPPLPSTSPNSSLLEGKQMSNTTASFVSAV